jgi:hypothetical protein
MKKKLNPGSCYMCHYYINSAVWIQDEIYDETDLKSEELLGGWGEMYN